MLSAKQQRQQDYKLLLDYLLSVHRCTWFENPGGGSMRFLPNFGREGCEIFLGESTAFWCFILLLHFY
jgi:hypothetical protein